MTSPPPPAPKAPGWVIVGYVGKGGMGAVWKARRADGTIAALKVVDVAVGKASADAVRSLFRRESLACLNLDHPNLVHGLDAGATDDGRPFLALEFVEGRTLEDVVRAEGALDEARVVAVGAALARALDHAHRLGLLHGDVKPRNVMLGPAGEVKLLDLGLVVEAAHLVRHGFGTLGFSAPEVVAGGKSDARSDLFSLGATLAAAASGANPTKEAGFADRAPTRTAAGAPLSAGLAAVLGRLLKSDPSARYGSAAELILDLDALAAGERPLGAILGGAAAGAVRRGPRIAAIVAGLALASAVAFYFATRPSPPPDVVAPRPTSAPVETKPPVDAVVRDPRIDGARMFVEKFPDDFARGREMIDDAERAAVTQEHRDEVAAMRAALERRADRAASTELASRRRDVESAFAAADVARAKAAADGWPAALSAAPQAATLRGEVKDGVARLVAARTALAEEAERLASAPRADSFDADARRVADRIRAALASPAFDGDGRDRLTAAAASIAQALDASASARSARETKDRLTAAVAALHARPSAQTLRDALDAAAADAATADAALAVDAEWKRAESDLTARCAALTGKTWCGPRGAALFVGVVAGAPSADEIFDSPLWSSSGGRAAALVAESASSSGAAAWLLARGRWSDARSLGDAAPAFLLADAPSSAEPSARPADADVGLALRAVGAAAPAAPDRGPVAAAWAAWVGGARPTHPAALVAKNREKETGRDAFFKDDLAAAAAALAEAAAFDPLDAEVAALRGRVLFVGARALPTAPALLAAFSEGRRAWDLDGALVAGPTLCAEAGMSLVACAGGDLAARARPVVAAACEAADAAGRADVRMLTFAGSWRLAEGRASAALALLRRAVAKAPDDFDAAIALTRALHAAGDDVKARASLRRAREIRGGALPASADDIVKALGE
jgi:hypothetical protein